MKKMIDVIGFILFVLFACYLGGVICDILFNISHLLFYILTTGLLIASGYILAEPFLKKKQ